MPVGNTLHGDTIVLPKDELKEVISKLRSNGYKTIGPSFENNNIVYKEICSLSDMPIGMESSQGPSNYRLTKTNKNRYFDFIPGSHSWKQFLFPSKQHLFTAVKDDSWHLVVDTPQTSRFAFIGVRACELAAIEIQDKVFLSPENINPIYKARRENLFIISVNCQKINSTCFCKSLGTGPRVRKGYDLNLTELDDVFLIEIGSELGGYYLSSCNISLPSAFYQNIANQFFSDSIASFTRSVDVSNLPKVLGDRLESDYWNDVGKRCLSCANCTLVCPTCFCCNTVDSVNIQTSISKRELVWDSCFNPNFSYVFGGNTRPTIRSRYRQWLTHKFGSWVDQFGVPGCVGCGRCITWCPAGIDLTKEIAIIRQEEYS